MKRKSLLSIAMICLLSHGVMVQAQQEKKQGGMAGIGESPSEYPPYMGGKEHYLPDSPNYMAGKKHYLQGDSSSKTEKNSQGKGQIPLLRGEMESGDREKSEEQGGTQVQININVTPKDASNEYGVIFLPSVRPKHHGGTGSLPPHAGHKPSQTGDSNPNMSGGFQQGTTSFR
jgi:hypothetical protein